MTARACRLRRGEVDHELLWSLVGLTTLGAGWLVLRFAPLLVPSGCAFKAVTGWPCVTCGATRAVQALAGVHVVDALRWNPLVTLLVVAWGAYIPYGAGAAAGLWPRIRVEASARERAAARMMAMLAVAIAWGFLAVDGR